MNMFTSLVEGFLKTSHKIIVNQSHMHGEGVPHGWTSEVSPCQTVVHDK